MITFLSPQPAAHDVPARFPNPFAIPPHPLALRAAADLQAKLPEFGFAETGSSAPGESKEPRGKMFGVLVVEDAHGRIGYLRAFSGLVNDRWDMDGFASATCNAEAWKAIWTASADEIERMSAAVDAIASGEEAAARAEIAAFLDRAQQSLGALGERHNQDRAERQRMRGSLNTMDVSAERDLRRLGHQSRDDRKERKRLRVELAEEKKVLEGKLAVVLARKRDLEEKRTKRCNEVLSAMQATYVIRNARGDESQLRALFAPREVPGGAGDCAGPKLLTHAYRNGLKPLALAEFWWGAPPVAGDRRPGFYYPACRGKCGPVLGFMLTGLELEAAPLFGGGLIGADQPRTLYEDEFLLVVDKPCGLLSVPGRNRELKDSVFFRLKRRYPEFTGPLLVHRLDLDTSGLLMVAKTAEVYKQLQRMFLTRQIEKNYVAWVEGKPARDRGIINLALRSDIDDRPRHVHDPIHGKTAVTEWQVLERAGDRTRIALYPRTGRTHQLRVHAAHPLGLNAPIVGDRLYGQVGERMLLHAERLCFEHPRDGRPVVVESRAPF